MGDRTDGLIAEIAALRAELDQVKRLGAARWGPRGWVDFSASLVWSSSGVAPALGNGALEAQYVLLAEDICLYEGAFFFGTTTTAGSGNYAVNLPFPAHLSGRASTNTPWIGNAKFFNNTSGLDIPGVVQIFGGSNVNFPMVGATSANNPSNWSATTPAAPANGRNMSWTLAYRIA